MAVTRVHPSPTAGQDLVRPLVVDPGAFRTAEDIAVENDPRLAAIARLGASNSDVQKL